LAARAVCVSRWSCRPDCRGGGGGGNDFCKKPISGWLPGGGLFLGRGGAGWRGLVGRLRGGRGGRVFRSFSTEGGGGGRAPGGEKTGGKNVNGKILAGGGPIFCAWPFSGGAIKQNYLGPRPWPWGIDGGISPPVAHPRAAFGFPRGSPGGGGGGGGKNGGGRRGGLGNQKGDHFQAHRKKEICGVIRGEFDRWRAMGGACFPAVDKNWAGGPMISDGGGGARFWGTGISPPPKLGGGGRGRRGRVGFWGGGGVFFGGGVWGFSEDGALGFQPPLSGQ